MSESETKSKSRERKARTTLSCRAPEAGTVAVAGTFNGWDPSASPPTRLADGTWAATLDLPPGRYEYKFLVDGRWCCDPGCADPVPGCPWCVPNPFGTMNRVVEVTT